MENFNSKLKEKEYHQFLTSGKIESIKLYQGNQYYYDIADKQHWIIDGGIELKLPHGYFSVAWNTSDDSIHFMNKSVDEIYTVDNRIELLEGSIQKVKGFVGEQITDVKFTWQEYDVVLDYTMKIRKELRLVEVVLEFSYNRILQIATIDYSLETNGIPTNYVYWIAQGILLSLRKLAIKDEGGRLRPEY